MLSLGIYKYVTQSYLLQVIVCIGQLNILYIYGQAAVRIALC